MNSTPKPYQQLAKVLREMGHERDAVRVHIARQRLTRHYERKRLRQSVKDRFGNLMAALVSGSVHSWDTLLRVGAGYGYRP